MKISIEDKVYQIEDLILPDLDLPNPCPITIEIRDDSLFLYIGLRDWQWDFEDESFVGCGTHILQLEEIK